ncbi:hypothetical protein D3C81_1477370 [compost metagenome]
MLQRLGKRTRHCCDAQTLGRKHTQQANITAVQAGLAMEQHLGPHLWNGLQQRQYQPCDANTVKQYDFCLGLGQRLAQTHAQPRPQQAPQMPPFQRPGWHVPFPCRTEPTAEPATQQQPVTDPGIGARV